MRKRVRKIKDKYPFWTCVEKYVYLVLIPLPISLFPSLLSLVLSLYGPTEEEDDNQDYIRDGFVVDEDEEEKERKIKKKLAKRGDLVDSDGTLPTMQAVLVNGHY
jgi:hypothetical protein